MPGHAGSPYWASVDFDSEGEENLSASPNQRVYLDPWDNEAYPTNQDTNESLVGDNANSFIGEPVSASFYYVPTKNYESEDEIPVPVNMPSPTSVDIMAPDYSIYGSRRSRIMFPEIHPGILYREGFRRERRRSHYTDEPIYAAHPIIYEPIYGPILLPPPHPGYLPPRSRLSMSRHPEFPTLQHAKRRKTSRMTDAYDHLTYESLSPEYEDWARPFPKTAPDNFHLSRYGHLQIDYSCSWNSLDRLIRNH